MNGAGQCEPTLSVLGFGVSGMCEINQQCGFRGIWGDREVRSTAGGQRLAVQFPG